MKTGVLCPQWDHSKAWVWHYFPGTLSCWLSSTPPLLGVFPSLNSFPTPSPPPLFPAFNK